MSSGQGDLFAQDDAERKLLAEPHRAALRSNIEATIARLEAATDFPWRNPLDAVHEENRVQRATDMLGQEGALLWARFDKEMERLHAAAFAGDGE